MVCEGVNVLCVVCSRGEVVKVPCNNHNMASFHFAGLESAIRDCDGVNPAEAFYGNLLENISSDGNDVFDGEYRVLGEAPAPPLRRELARKVSAEMTDPSKIESGSSPSELVKISMKVTKEIACHKLESRVLVLLFEDPIRSRVLFHRWCLPNFLQVQMGTDAKAQDIHLSIR